MSIIGNPVLLGGGGGGGVTVEPLSVSANGTYVPSSGTAFGPVAVNVAEKFTVPELTSVPMSAFKGNLVVTAVSWPGILEIGISAFASCTALETVYFPSCTTIQNSAFFACTSLVSADIPQCTSLGTAAFDRCSALKEAYFPNCTYVGDKGFSECYSLESVYLPNCVLLDNGLFQSCSMLSTLSFPKCSYIGAAFRYCERLTSLYLMSDTVVELNTSNCFTGTPIGGYSDVTGTFGSIYVPASLVETYKVTGKWSWFSERFVGV